MSTATQYNPNEMLNEDLRHAGASKTVYALVTRATEMTKMEVVNDPEYLAMFREAWTGKQDAMHREFFDVWHDWSKPVVDLDRAQFPFFYPTAGASEPLRQIIFDLAAPNAARDGRGLEVHIFEGEYEGYRAMAEAAGLKVVEHKRADWKIVERSIVSDREVFFISAPSAIDGNVWPELNAFLDSMPPNSVIADVTYVGAVPARAVSERFNLNARSVRSVVFSLSKPFGMYYDRCGGVFCRKENLALFGNQWFKNLTSIALGTRMMRKYKVFHFPNALSWAQQAAVEQVGIGLAMRLQPSDVYILANGDGQGKLEDYVRRAGKLRICLTPLMSEMVGTAKKEVA